MGFFLWGYIKQRVYLTPPPLRELRNRITDAYASVSSAMLYSVRRDVQSRVQTCIVAERYHFEHDKYMSLIFGKCSFVQCEKTNVRFVFFIYVFFVRNFFSCTSSMMLKIFSLTFFPNFALFLR